MDDKLFDVLLCELQKNRQETGKLTEKVDEFITTIDARCANRGAEIAVLKNHDTQRTRERNKLIDRRIAIGLLLIAILSFILKFAF